MSAYGSLDDDLASLESMLRKQSLGDRAFEKLRGEAAVDVEVEELNRVLDGDSGRGKRGRGRVRGRGTTRGRYRGGKVMNVEQLEEMLDASHIHSDNTSLSSLTDGDVRNARREKKRGGKKNRSSSVSSRSSISSLSSRESKNGSSNNTSFITQDFQPGSSFDLFSTNGQIELEKAERIAPDERKSDYSHQYLVAAMLAFENKNLVHLLQLRDIISVISVAAPDEDHEPIHYPPPTLVEEDITGFIGSEAELYNTVVNGNLYYEMGIYATNTTPQTFSEKEDERVAGWKKKYSKSMKSNSAEGYFHFELDDVRQLAVHHGYKEVQLNPQSRVIAFEKGDRNRHCFYKFHDNTSDNRAFDESRSSWNLINVYYSTGTVGTCVLHPKKGRTQYFRRGVRDAGVSMADLERIFANPRVHLGQAYGKKKGKVGKKFGGDAAESNQSSGSDGDCEGDDHMWDSEDSDSDEGDDDIVMTGMLAMRDKSNVNVTTNSASVNVLTDHLDVVNVPQKGIQASSSHGLQQRYVLMKIVMFISESYRTLAYHHEHLKSYQSSAAMWHKAYIVMNNITMVLSQWKMIVLQSQETALTPAQADFHNFTSVYEILEAASTLMEHTESQREATIKRADIKNKHLLAILEPQWQQKEGMKKKLGNFWLNNPSASNKHWEERKETELEQRGLQALLAQLNNLKFVSFQ